MPAKKKLTSLSKKTVSARKADAVKGGRKRERASADTGVIINRRGHNLNHNQTLRTPT